MADADEKNFIVLENEFMSDNSDKDWHYSNMEDINQTLSTNIQWTRQLTTELILLLKPQRVLWDPNVIKENQTVKGALSLIAVQLAKLDPKIKVNDIKTKIHTIRSQYRKELRRMRNLELRGKNPKPQLWCFALLDFLWPICTNGEEMPSLTEIDLSPEVALALNMREMYAETGEDMSINCFSPHDQSITWNREKTKILIMLYKSNSVLWDNKFKDNYKLRNEAIKHITFEMAEYIPNITTHDIKAKLHTIRSQYRKELNDLAQNKNKLQFSEDKKSKLWCFEMLSFLLPTFTKNPQTPPKVEHIEHIEEVQFYEDITPSDDDNFNVPFTSYEELDYNIECLDEEVVQSVSETVSHENQTDNLNNLNEPRFFWLGNQVVATLNEIQDEDIIYDTVIALKKLLAFAKQKEKNILNDPLSTKLEVLDGFEAEAVRQSVPDTILESNNMLYNTFDLKFDVTFLELQEISVKVINQTIVVQGIHQSGKPTKFFRRYDLPSEFDINTVKAILSDDNMLTVQASKTTLANLVGERDIPIYRTYSKKSTEKVF